MTTEKLKQLGILLVLVFVGACGTQFLANGVNIFESNWSTWQVIINSGVVAVVTTLVAYIAPMYKSFGLGSGS